jgi:hypothetical protein
LSVSCDTCRIYRTDPDTRRPPPFLEPPDEAVVERVVHDVLHRRLVLLVGLDHLRPVAPAEEVVDPSMALVEGAGVAAVQVPHAFVQVRFGRLDDEVEVVPHQAAHVHAPVVAALDAAEDMEEDAAILVVEHDRTVVVATCRDVVEGAGFEVAGWPSHRPKVAPRR